MNSVPAVIVNKGGFFSALVRGVFGTIITVVICGTALGLYGMHMLDRHVSMVSSEVLHALPDWQQLLPPVLADALNDRRAPDYRDALEITSRYVSNERHDDRGAIVLDIYNKGTQTVSLLTLHMTVEDNSPERFCELNETAVTPLALGNHPGPLQPGSHREVIRYIRRVVGEPAVKVEVSDVRIWNGPTDKATKQPATGSTAQPT